MFISLVNYVVQGRNYYNNPDVHRLEIPATNGACTARGLAQSFHGVVMGNVLKQTTIDVIKQPIFIDEPELAIDMKITMGLGFGFSKSKLVSHSNVAQQHSISRMTDG